MGPQLTLLTVARSCAHFPSRHRYDAPCSGPDWSRYVGSMLCSSTFTNSETLVASGNILRSAAAISDKVMCWAYSANWSASDIARFPRRRSSPASSFQTPSGIGRSFDSHALTRRLSTCSSSDNCACQIRPYRASPTAVRSLVTVAPQHPTIGWLAQYDVRGSPPRSRGLLVDPIGDTQ